MSQNSGPFLVSSHGHPAFNPRLPSSSLKRTGNGSLSIGNSPNPSIGSSMNISSSPSTMRPSNSMGPMKPGTVGMNPIDKSNSLPYSSRYTRKVWPMSRSIHDKPIRGHDDHEPSYLRSALPSDSINNSSFTIEPSADDDEADDIYFSSRHMAAARFQRNQRLLCEIFNEVCIPDLRSNVNVDRILTLRRQVDALKTHRETFEKDLNELEEKHVEKKRKCIEANEKFHNEYLEASSKKLTQEKINEILQKYEAMEKLQKEKQLLLQQQQQYQQQQAVATLPQPQLSVSATTTVSQSTTPAAITTTEPLPTVEAPQEQTPTPPPSVQTHLPPSQTVPAPLPSSQAVPNQLPPSQSVPPQLPPTQSIQSQIAPTQPIQPQLPLPTPVIQQGPPQQQQQPTPTSQSYPMMHPGSSCAPASVYGHPQQTQYRPPSNQRPAQYPSNAQWQQQQQQQQWQTNTYDPRYYNPYPPNAQWSQQQPQQQWSSSQSQQQMSMASQQQPPQMRGGPPQQQPQMYANGVHYGYGSPTAAWNTGTHPSQQYGYSPNPSYDPSLASTPPQQYYPPSQMHNPPQGYDYGPQPPQMN